MRLTRAALARVHQARHCPRVSGLSTALEHNLESLVNPPGDFGDLLASRRAKFVEAELCVFISHIHAIDHDAMEVHV